MFPFKLTIYLFLNCGARPATYFTPGVLTFFWVYLRLVTFVFPEHLFVSTSNIPLSSFGSASVSSVPNASVCVYTTTEPSVYYRARKQTVSEIENES